MRHAIILLTGVLSAATIGCATQDAFTTADTDRNGSVATEEFERYMKQAVFDEIDTNRDGRVTAEEWRAVNPSKPISRFEEVDRDGDGGITRPEADAQFDRRASLRDLFAKIDTNRDGALSREEADAFRARMNAQPGTSKIEKLSQAAQ